MFLSQPCVHMPAECLCVWFIYGSPVCTSLSLFFPLLRCNSGLCSWSSPEGPVQLWYLLTGVIFTLQQLLNPNRPCSRASQVFVAGRSSWEELFPVSPSDSSRCQRSKAAVDGEEGAPLLTANVGGIRVDEPSPGLFICSKDPLW